MDVYELLRDELANLCKLCYDRGHVAAANGNVSARTPDGNGILIKTSGTSFSDLSPDDLLFVDWKGRAFDCDDMSPAERRPSMELQLHAWIYPLRDDVGAVVHLHSPYATALSCAGAGEIPLAVLEARHILKRVPVIPVYEAGSRELATAVLNTFSNPAVLAAVLREHGPVAVGKNLRDAYNIADMLEHNAKVAAIARGLH